MHTCIYHLYIYHTLSIYQPLFSYLSPASQLSIIYLSISSSDYPFSNSGLWSTYLPIKHLFISYLFPIYCSSVFPITHPSSSTYLPSAHPIFHSSIICHPASYQLFLISHLSVYLFICPLSRISTYREVMIKPGLVASFIIPALRKQR